MLKVLCNLNNAACKLKLKQHKEAEKLCTKVLEVDDKNVKALYRRAHAYINLVELELAENDIKKALEIDPGNRYAAVICLHRPSFNAFVMKLKVLSRDVKSVYNILKQKVKEYNRKDAQFYGNIIAKMSKLEQTQSEVSGINVPKPDICSCHMHNQLQYTFQKN